MVSRTSKLILINAVKHSEAHNRRQEERDMWQQRRNERHDREEHKSTRRHKDDIYFSFRHGGHLDQTKGESSSKKRSEPKTSNKWAAELMKYEESLGDDRWGHGGYKELYPDDFSGEQNMSSESTSDVEDKGKKKKKRKHKKKKHKREEDSKESVNIKHDNRIEIPPVYVVRDDDSDTSSITDVTRKRKHDLSDSDNDIKRRKKSKKEKSRKKNKHKSKKKKS